VSALKNSGKSEGWFLWRSLGHRIRWQFPSEKLVETGDLRHFHPQQQD
jgi:hypothetical protein